MCVDNHKVESSAAIRVHLFVFRAFIPTETKIGLYNRSGAHKNLPQKYLKEVTWKDLRVGLDRRTILKEIINKLECVWNGFNWLRYGVVAGPCGKCNAPSGSMKYVEFIVQLSHSKLYVFS